jgi:hypothetical protein
LEHEERGELAGAIRAKLGEYDAYWELREPTQAGGRDPTRCSLAADLTEIYSDFQDGLLYWRPASAVALPDVVWQWRFSFETHWGARAASALRAINTLLHVRHIDALQERPGRGTPVR